MQVTNWFKRQRRNTNERNVERFQVAFSNGEHNYGQIWLYADETDEKLVLTMTPAEFDKLAADIADIVARRAAR